MRTKLGPTRVGGVPVDEKGDGKGVTPEPDVREDGPVRRLPLDSDHGRRWAATGGHHTGAGGRRRQGRTREGPGGPTAISSSSVHPTGVRTPHSTRGTGGVHDGSSRYSDHTGVWDLKQSNQLFHSVNQLIEPKLTVNLVRYTDL